MSDSSPLILDIRDPRDTETSELRGAKGRSLAIMARLGMRVPPGFTITTMVARYFMSHEGKLPPKAIDILRSAMVKLEAESGCRFGDPQNPLLVSVRSGAGESMPGMMDTILNVGVTTKTMAGLVGYGGEDFATNCRIRLRAMFLDIVGELPPDDPWEQLLIAIKSVFHSWNNPHAKTFREINGLNHHLGTAVTVQAMVYGNRCKNSGTGVARTINNITGDEGLCGEYLPSAQGEDVVSGERTPLSIDYLKEVMPEIYNTLKDCASAIEEIHGSPVEIEFTIESGKLYLLQYRNEMLSAVAAAVHAVRCVDNGLLRPEEAVGLLSSRQIEELLKANGFDRDALDTATKDNLIAYGLAASRGSATGRVAFTSEKAEEMARCGVPVILVREKTTPRDLRGMLAAVGIVTEEGGITSHGAVVANSQYKPAVVGVGTFARYPVEGEWISIDTTGPRGIVVAGELPGATYEHGPEVKKFLGWVAVATTTKKSGRRIDATWLDHKLALNDSFANFYLTWAMAREARGTMLEEQSATLRDKTHAELASAMVTYLATAIIRELNDTEARGSAYVYVREDLKWLEEHCNAFGGTRLLRAIVEAISKLLVPDQAKCFRIAATIFEKGHWEIAFCGAPWNEIATLVAAYLEGMLPDDATFVDLVFNLKHHGGLLFDKHQVFKNPSSNERVLQRQLAANLTVVSIQELLARVCTPCQCDLELNFRFAPSAEVMKLWRSGVQAKIWKEVSPEETLADYKNACEKNHEPHTVTPVAVGPFTVCAAALGDIKIADVQQFADRTQWGGVLVLLSSEKEIQERYGVNVSAFNCIPKIISNPLVDHGGVPEDWKLFIQKIFNLLVARREILIACIGGHGRTGCCIASLIAYVENPTRTPDPIAAVRERYCMCAVESRKQAEAVFALRGQELPQRYVTQFPDKKHVYPKAEEEVFAP